MLATTAPAGPDQLRGVIESLWSQVLTDLPDAQLEEDLTELHGAIEALEVERLRRLAHAERRGIHERDGHLSITAWCVTRFSMGWGRAKELVSAARALEQMPETLEALQGQEIFSSALKLLVRAREVDPEAFSRSESVLVDAARIHRIADLHRVLSHWSLLAEQERYPDAEERRQARRSLHASATLYGMTRTDGDLTPEVGACFLSALGAVMDAEAHRGGTGERTASQRRHDALGIICRAFLDSKDRPAVAGELPHLSVVVPMETLISGTGEAELEHVGPIGAEFARQLACDASLRRILRGPQGEVLDVGRASPVVPKGIRRAVIARDKTCAFPACGAPASCSDAHHVVHWADGGETALGNLALLCRGHHTLIHAKGGFSMQMLDGRPVFRRADGSVLQDRGPPG
jgi:Domain of unknown function (DUF222)/HNH endonuclease